MLTEQEICFISHRKERPDLLDEGASPSTSVHCLGLPGAVLPPNVHPAGREVVGSSCAKLPISRSVSQSVSQSVSRSVSQRKIEGEKPARNRRLVGCCLPSSQQQELPCRLCRRQSSRSEPTCPKATYTHARSQRCRGRGREGWWGGRDLGCVRIEVFGPAPRPRPIYTQSERVSERE